MVLSMAGQSADSFIVSRLVSSHHSLGHLRRLLRLNLLRNLRAAVHHAEQVPAPHLHDLLFAVALRCVVL